MVTTCSKSDFFSHLFFVVCCCIASRGAGLSSVCKYSTMKRLIYSTMHSLGLASGVFITISILFSCFCTFINERSNIKSVYTVALLAARQIMIQK
jgi:hypothetical protein